MGYLIQYSAPRNTVWTAFAARRDHSSMCGRYVTPGEAAMERAYSLTAIPCGTCVREHSAGSPPKSRPSRHPGRAPPGHGGGHGRRPSAPHAGTPGNGGPASTRPAPRRADPRVPGFQFARLPPAPALPARRSRPPGSPPGRETENLESWEPGESANARQDPGFQIPTSSTLSSVAPRVRGFAYTARDMGAAE